MRIAFVVNPNARAVTPASTERALARWSRGHELTVVRTEPGAANARQLAAAIGGTAAVVVFGGDGTVNDVVHAMVTSGTDATLVPLPVGTTNVVARTLGLPADPAAAEAVAFDALAAGHSVRRGIGWLNDTAFVANAGIGLDAAVVARTEAHAHRKKRWGHAWFFTAALRESAPRKGIRSVRLRHAVGGDAGALHTDRHGAAGTGATNAACGPAPAFWVLALAAHPYTYVGRRPVELLPPGSGPDGALAVLWFSPMRYGRLLRLTARSVLTSGGITCDAGVRELTISSRLELTSAAPVMWQTDGEARAPATDFVLRWQADALRVVDVVRASASPPGR